VKRLKQPGLFCHSCGGDNAVRTGLCPPCYRARSHSRARFAGHREAILDRDQSRCRICGAAKPGRYLHVHHRDPGVNDPERMLTVCAACHAQIHRTAAIKTYRPEELVSLWAEQHPGVPVQLQLPIEVPG
jgi:hypothetical protein